MKSSLRAFSFAWHFLTIVPLPGASQADPRPQELAASMRWYPVVGFIVGAGLVCCDALLAHFLAPSLSTLLLIVLLVVLTGGLHLDGLTDTIDGLAGGGGKEQRLAVMRDGRIGAIGATGLVLALALRYVGFLGLPHPERAALLLCMPAVGRWAMVVSAFSSSHARAEGGLASPFFEQLGFRDLVWATVLVTAGLLVVLGVWATAIVLIIGVALSRLIVFCSTRVFGGMTGDVLGTTNEVMEILYLLLCPSLLVFR